MTTTDAETDLYLIRAIQQGDRDAFAEFYDLHSPWLMSVAFRILQNQRDAEDLLHDVFLEIWKKASSYDSKRGSVRSWLAIKIRSRAVDRVRTLNTLKKHIVVQKTTDYIPEPVTHDTANKDVEHEQAKQLLEQLTHDQRTVIELSYFRGLTCQEIAQHCQIPLGTAKSVLQRALLALRKEFKSKEVVSHANR